jgi:hypothetical protein
MKREVARAIHSSTNITYWLENPNWSTGNTFGDIASKAFRLLPFSIHEAQKSLFFDTEKVIAVSGESVVAHGTDPGTVDKFMFRYPGNLGLENFEKYTSREVKTVTENLSGIALPTSVSIKPALIFRFPVFNLSAVAQIQPYIDTILNPSLDLNALKQERTSSKLDKTAQDLEALLKGAQILISQHGYILDIAPNSSNLRRNSTDGSVTLIDVMPAYLNGSRLIGDTPNNLVDHIQTNMHDIQQFVGQFGS